MSCASNSGIIKATSIPQVCANSSTLTDVLNVIFVLIGAISLLVVVIGGFRYIRAGSNDTIIAESKRMIAHGSVENPAVHIIQVATSIVALLAGFLAVFMIMISGFQYVTSGGSDEAVSNAKKRLRSALIGLVVVALAWTIIRFVKDSLLS
jgi:hypothetical protein